MVRYSFGQKWKTGTAGHGHGVRLLNGVVYGDIGAVYANHRLRCTMRKERRSSTSMGHVVSANVSAAPKIYTFRLSFFTFCRVAHTCH